MIGYVTLGSNDVARAGQFYDGVLAEVGREGRLARVTRYGRSIGKP